MAIDFYEFTESLPNTTKGINVFINSKSGSTDSAACITSYFLYSPFDISTIVCGCAVGPSCMLCAFGHERYAVPYAKFMHHCLECDFEYDSRSEGYGGQKAGGRFFMRDLFADFYKRTLKDANWWGPTCAMAPSYMYWFNAMGALDIGVIDKIGWPK
ncbi:MAG: hypothetical protein GY861_22535 [bacterium]|nr:hypothetical protein [bacterium]